MSSSGGMVDVRFEISEMNIREPYPQQSEKGARTDAS